MLRVQRSGSIAQLGVARRALITRATSTGTWPARNHTPAANRPKKFPGPKEGEEGYVKDCYWCELGFLLKVHLNNHLQRPNSHCEWVPVELPAAPEADAESPGSD